MHSLFVGNDIGLMDSHRGIASELLLISNGALDGFQKVLLRLQDGGDHLHPLLARLLVSLDLDAGGCATRIRRAQREPKVFLDEAHLVDLPPNKTNQT